MYLLFYVSVLTVALSLLSCFFYTHITLKRGAVVEPNYRSLHTRAIPKGAGIVMAGSFMLLLALLLGAGIINFEDIFLPIAMGTLLTTVSGFMDDWFTISKRARLTVQFMVASILLFFVLGPTWINLGFGEFYIGYVILFFSTVALVWFYNLFNFMDGSDGIAASQTIFITIFFSVIFYIENHYELLMILLMIGSVSLGFLFLNFPPARVFLGDVGTNFLSYTISVVMLFSVWKLKVNVWVWFIILAYYISDTTCTLISRLIKTPHKWCFPHRSHAYQNMSRVVLRSHLKTLAGLWALNILWLAPMASVAYVFPDISALICAIAYSPIIMFVIKFGPRYKDD